MTPAAGRWRLVRNGFLPEDPIRTGIGPVPIRQPRVRDCGAGGGSEPICFTSAILPRYLRRSRSPDELLPWLHLKGISTGDLVVIGADEHGRKELVGLTDGYRESEPSWRELLVDLRRRGLEIGPELAVGDGNLGFWKALRQVYGAAREQRCWVHKTFNVLTKLPPGLQAKAKQHLQAIWMAEGRQAAEAAFNSFVGAYGAKYDKAVACLARDREALLAFDFPAEHWKHVRTANPIESTLATVRLRTTRTKGRLSRRIGRRRWSSGCAGARRSVGAASTGRVGSARSSVACASSMANARSRMPPDAGPYTTSDHNSHP